MIDSRTKRAGTILQVSLAALALAAAAETQAAPNLLVAILDDVGIDRLAAYGAANAARTPNIDALARRGVLFRNAWASPTCSPSRASALTGKLPERTGIGGAIVGPNELARDEVTLAHVLSQQGYATAAIGKWHLGSRPRHPIELGFDTHRGTPGNLGPGGYYRWRKWIDGADQGWQTAYVTTETANDAIEWITRQRGPWFVWLGFHAAHKPLHAPPESLHRSGPLVGTGATGHFKAIVEALDTELGRVVTAAGSDTTIVVVSDNGPYASVIEPPFPPSHGKGSSFEVAINVPLIIAGPGVSPQNRGKTSNALVHVADLFATLAELAQSDATAEDSISLTPQLVDAGAPGRKVLYTSGFRPNGGPPSPSRYKRAARNDRYKLLRSGVRTEQLFDLEADPHEQVDLLTAPLAPADREAWESLARAIDEREWGAPDPFATSQMLLAAGLSGALALAGYAVFAQRRRRAKAG